MATDAHGYVVGQISQLISHDSGKKSKKKSRQESDVAENTNLKDLFSTGNVSQPLFVPISTKLSSKTKVIKTKNFQQTDVREEPTETEVDEDSERSKLTSVKKHDGPRKPRTRKRNKKEENAEDTKRLERTIFVGNLPVKVKRKTLKKLFKVYGEIESVRLRSGALEQPSNQKDVIRRGMILGQFHPERHNINAYVVFKDIKAAHDSLQSNGSVVDDFHIRVDLANNKEHDHKKSVFVGNLLFDIEEESLRNEFCDCGNITGIRIVRDKATGLGKGIAFINFETSDSVTFALKKNGTDFKGRKLRIFRSSENPKRKASDEVKRKPGKASQVSHSFSGLQARKLDKDKQKNKKFSKDKSSKRKLFHKQGPSAVKQNGKNIYSNRSSKQGNKAKMNKGQTKRKPRTRIRGKKES